MLLLIHKTISHHVNEVSRSHSDTPHSVELLCKTEPARRRDLYRTHNTHKGDSFMLTAGFEPTIPASELSQAHALDRAAAGIGRIKGIHKEI